MNIGIVGAGIIGVNTGLVLAQAGHTVTILSRDRIQKTTSWAAAAMCYPVNVEESERCRKWFKASIGHMKRLASIEGSGVHEVDWMKCTRDERFAAPFWLNCVEDWRLLQADECPDAYQCGLYARIYSMNVDEYYPWMLAAFEEAGGAVSYVELGSLSDISDDFDVVINCTGVFAKDIAHDYIVKPARGQVVVVKNPGITNCITSFDEPFYIYPRGDQCVLGGSFEEGRWSMSPDDELTQAILNRAAEFDERLKDSEVIDVRVGLRPLRTEVRLEKDALPDGTPVIHNYGHGGAGYTLSWGCAEDVKSLVSARRA